MITMAVTRQAVFERLAAESDATTGATTTVRRLAMALGADHGEIERHLEALIACELACTGPDGDIRVTTTGEALLALAPDETVIVDPCPDGNGRDHRTPDIDGNREYIRE